MFGNNKTTNCRKQSMMKFACGCALLALLSFSATAQRCVVGKRSNEGTYQCCNVLEKFIEPVHLAMVRGTVETVPRVLVEIFSNPAWIKNDSWMPTSKQRRIIGCVTNSNGYFKIGGLKKGNYELRVSAPKPWTLNVSHWYITIDPRNGRNKKLAIELSQGS